MDPGEERRILDRENWMCVNLKKKEARRSFFFATDTKSVFQILI